MVGSDSDEDMELVADASIKPKVLSNSVSVFLTKFQEMEGLEASIHSVLKQKEGKSTGKDVAKGKGARANSALKFKKVSFLKSSISVIF